MVRITTILGLIFAMWALPAAAGHDRHPRATRGDAVRGPERDERLVQLAHELERAARHVHGRAGRSTHHRDRRESRALRALHRLDERARHLHRQVEQGGSAAHTSVDFERVRSAFHRAEARLYGLHANRHVERDFDRVARAVHSLERIYARRDHHAHDQRYAYTRGWRHPFWLRAAGWR